MALFKCKNCGSKKEILKQTIIIKKRKLVVKEALCQCGIFMDDSSKYKGFGTSFKAENDKIK